MADRVMKSIQKCLLDKTDFLLSGGAGSGKTYTLMQTLNYIFTENARATVACITYTNIAAEEIKERSPYTKLYVSTIHEFLWEQIKDFQKNLKITILQLIANEKEAKGSGLSYSGEEEITEDSFVSIKYENYRNLSQGIISHDDVLKVANVMFATYPLLSKIISDKFDYIFIDEYQDTQKAVVDIFLKHTKVGGNQPVCIGLFGDSMQSIYATGIGNIREYVESGAVVEIIKGDNYRCAVHVIELLNKLRTDIQQEPAKRSEEGDIINKTGTITFLHSTREFDLECFKQSEFSKDWDFDDVNETKILFLTHRLSAIQLGFAELLAAYRYPDSLIGKEPDRFAQHLLKIGRVLCGYYSKEYADVIATIDTKIKNNADKKRIGTTLREIVAEITLSIHDAILRLDREKIVKKDDKFTEYIKGHEDFYFRVKELHLSQVIAYYKYYNSFSPYSTQHGIKGAEFENVLVVMDNGRWNQYNFQYYFEKTKDKETIIARTEKLFYVCCSRAKDNLIVYYPNPTPEILLEAERLFGKENVIQFN